MAAKPIFAAGLDAGSARTRSVVALVENGRIRFLGHGEVDSIGWSRGRIADGEALAMCIQASMRQAEASSGASVAALVAGVGSGVDCFNHRGTYDFARPHQVNRDDLDYAIRSATDIRLESGRAILQVFPQDFTLDGRAFHRNPAGATCTRLDANVHILTAPRQEHDVLVGAVHRAHFAIEETVFEGVAAAYAALLPEDRLRGVASLDIGMESSDLVVYDGDVLLLARSLPVAGDHMTRDAAYGLKVTYHDAERLKQEYGCALLGLTSDNSLVELPSAEGRPPREAPRRQLNEILEARAEELFFFVRNELAALGGSRNLLEGIVLSGGAARLNGMCDLAERVLNVPARNGLATGIEDWPEELNDPAWAVAAGLAMYSARLKLKRDDRRKAPGAMGMLAK